MHVCVCVILFCLPFDEHFVNLSYLEQSFLSLNTFNNNNNNEKMVKNLKENTFSSVNHSHQHVITLYQKKNTES